MRILQATLKNFRCFSDQQFDFHHKFIVIEGNNGVGKTSLLEALHYVCYLRSFRTSSGFDLIGLQSDHFFIQVKVEESKEFELEPESSLLQIGFSSEGKSVKYNGKPVSSHKQLLQHYRVVSITEDDLELIRGAPEIRRAFLQQSLLLLDTTHSSLITQYKKVLLHRNSLLFKNKGTVPSAYTLDELKIWSEQLWQQSRQMIAYYQSFLAELESQVNQLLAQYFAQDGFSVSFEYQVKYPEIYTTEDFEIFWKEWAPRFKEEFFQGRTLFGVHLDDFIINFKTKKAKIFASRGQQKLVVFLMKYAQFYLVGKNSGLKSCLLLDDFLTDFDRSRLEHCLELLDQSQVQVFITCPINFESLISVRSDIQRILL